MSERRVLIVTPALKELDKAAERYRSTYNWAHQLSSQGEDEKAQAILDKANAEYDAAKAAYAAAGGAQYL